MFDLQPKARRISSNGRTDQYMCFPVWVSFGGGGGDKDNLRRWRFEDARILKSRSSTLPNQLWTTTRALRDSVALQALTEQPGQRSLSLAFLRGELVGIFDDHCIVPAFIKEADARHALSKRQ